jgi:uncharacterized repeat protein (TIGR01451 family)
MVFGRPIIWRVMTVFLLAAYAPAGLALPDILPTAQFMTGKGIDPVVVDTTWVIAIDRDDPDEARNAVYLAAELTEEFSLNLAIVDISTATQTDKRIVLGKPAANARIDQIVAEKGIYLDPMIGQEGYILDVSSTPDIVIAANFSAGVFHGIQSLLKKTDGSFQALSTVNGTVRIDGLFIKDWPDKPLRGVFLDTLTDTEVDKSNGHLDRLARLKMNFLSYGYNNDASWLGKLDRIYRRAGELFIDPAPRLRGLGASGPILDLQPNIAEGIHAENEKFWFAWDATSQAYVATPVKPVIETSKIQNPAFESMVSSSSSGWYLQNNSNNPTNSWAWAPGEGRNGSNAMKMVVTEQYAGDNPNVFYGQLSQTLYIPVEGGKTYTLSFWVKTQGVGGLRLPQITVVQYQQNKNDKSPGTNESITTDIIPTGTQDWTQHFLSIKTVPETAFLSIYARTGMGGYGTMYLDDFELRRMDGALTNVLRTASTGIRVTSIDGTTVYTNGVDYAADYGALDYYQVINGVGYSFYPLAIPNYDPVTRVRLLPGGAIDPLQQVNIDYDFGLCLVNGSTACRKHTYSINDSWTYPNVVFPYMDKMLNLCSGYDANGVCRPLRTAFYPIDELWGVLNRDSRNGHMANYQLFATDINTIYEHVKSRSLRLLFWDDMVNPWHNGNDPNLQHWTGGQVGATEPQDLTLPRTTALLPRTDLIPVVWQYDVADTQSIRANAPGYFEGAACDATGFEWVAAPFNKSDNVRAWADVIRNRPPGCNKNLGMIVTTWNYDYSGIDSTADYAWNLDQVTDTGPPSAVDVAVRISDAPDPALISNTVIYSVIIQDNGPGPATGVVLTGTLPSLFTVASVSPSQGSCNQSSGTITCVLGLLRAAASATIEIRGVPTGAGQLNFSASATAGQYDPVTTNNTATVTTTVTAPDLTPTAMSISKSGSKVSVTDTVKNQGNANAGPFTVKYYLSTDTAYSSNDLALATASGGSTACTRTVTSLNAGASSGISNQPCYKPAGVVSRTLYYVLAVDDADNQVIESNEANNVRATAGTVKW